MDRTLPARFPLFKAQEDLFPYQTFRKLHGLRLRGLSSPRADRLLLRQVDPLLCLLQAKPSLRHLLPICGPVQKPKVLQLLLFQRETNRCPLSRPNNKPQGSYKNARINNGSRSKFKDSKSRRRRSINNNCFNSRRPRSSNNDRRWLRRSRLRQTLTPPRNLLLAQPDPPLAHRLSCLFNQRRRSRSRRRRSR